MFLCPFCQDIREHAHIGHGVYCCETCSSEKIPFDLSSNTGRNLDGVNLAGRFFYKRNTYLLKKLTMLGICKDTDVLIIEREFNKIQTIFDRGKSAIDAKRGTKSLEGSRHNLLPLNYLISKIIEKEHLNIAYNYVPKSKKTLDGFIKVWNDIQKNL